MSLKRYMATFIWELLEDPSKANENVREQRRTIIKQVYYIVRLPMETLPDKHEQKWLKRLSRWEEEVQRCWRHMELTHLRLAS